MRKREIFDFESSHGLKSIEIVCDDILSLSELADILVVSAFQNNYKTLPQTLIGALSTVGIHVASLARIPLLDMRVNQHVWLSDDLGENAKVSRRIACVEFRSRKDTGMEMSVVRERMLSLFAMLSAASYTGIPIKNVVMPILGSNSQDYDSESMAELILREGYHALETIPQFMRLQVIEMNHERYNALRDAFNKILGRDKTDFVADSLYEITKKKIEQMKQDFTYIRNLKTIYIDKKQFDLVAASFDGIEKDPRYIAAIKCRRLAEMAATDLLAWRKYSTKDNLNGKIEKVCGIYSIPKWIKYYWHTMRELGNVGAHVQKLAENGDISMEYHHPNENDMNIMLLCSVEVLHAWRNLRAAQEDSYL